MKCVHLPQLNEKEKDNALNEVRVLASVDHPNVIGFKEAFFDSESSQLCVVMEYAQDGDLLQLIEEHKKSATYFSEGEIW